VPQVLADNEEVVFDEGIPAAPSTIYELLLGAFAERRRAMTSFIVDGKDFINNEDLPDQFKNIEAKSITHAELTMRLSIQFLNMLSSFENQISAYQVNLLVTPWSEVFKRTDDFISKIQPFADLVDNIVPFAQSYEPKWAEDIFKIATSQAEQLNRILKCFENADPGGLSDEIADNFLPLFKSAISLFESSIIPDLKERKIEDEKNYLS
jgi:hypothetical protein